ncbi:MAG: hypothetical protein MI741_01840, partial [Rhodospirillales bacterium]|nr:hypothetical protein [Rhodospirillales bacterium]
MNNRAENPQNLTEQLTVAWTKAQPMVTAYIASTIHKPDDVEDVLQEVAVAVARGYESSDRSLPFGPWAMGIARHKVFDYHRRNARDKHLFDDELLHAVE